MTTSPLTPSNFATAIDDSIARAKANHPANSLKAKLRELDESWWMNSDGIMLSSMPEALEARHYPIYQQVVAAHNQRIYHTQTQKAIDRFNEKRRELTQQEIIPTIIPTQTDKKWWQI